MAATLTVLGDWPQEINSTLQKALAASMFMCGRTGEEACKHALILMAQSASKMTPKAPARRPVETNSQFRHLLRKNENGSTYKEARQAGRYMGYYFKWTAMRLNQQPNPDVPLFGNTRNSVAMIAKSRRGLAQRSWFWGLGQVGGFEGKPLAGAYRMFTINSGDGKTVGYGKEDRLGYIAKIMPSGWNQSVAQLAGNKIMKMAANRITSQFYAAVRSGNQSRMTTRANLASHFKALA
jgi:hypothetical protein